MKHSQLLYFAYADFEEERMKFDNVKKIYDNLLTIDHIDPTLVNILFLSINDYAMDFTRCLDLHPADEIHASNRRCESC